MSDKLPNQKSREKPLVFGNSKDNAKNFTDRDLYIIYKALFCVKDLNSDGGVALDYDKLKTAIGDGRYRPTAEAWNKVKKKLAENAAQMDTIVVAERRRKRESLQEDPDYEDVSNGLGVRDPEVRKRVQRKASKLSTATDASTDGNADLNSPSLKIAPRVAPQEDDDTDTEGDAKPATKKIKVSHKSRASMKEIVARVAPQDGDDTDDGSDDERAIKVKMTHNGRASMKRAAEDQDMGKATGKGKEVEDVNSNESDDGGDAEHAIKKIKKARKSRASMKEIAPRVAPQGGDDTEDGSDDEGTIKVKMAHNGRVSMKQTAENQDMGELVGKGKEVQDVNFSEFVHDSGEDEDGLQAIVFHPGEATYSAHNLSISPHLLDTEAQGGASGSQGSSGGAKAYLNEAEASIQDDPIPAKETTQVWTEAAQRRYDSTFGNNDDDMFNTAPPPLPPSDYGFGWGRADYSDDPPSGWYN